MEFSIRELLLDPDSFFARPISEAEDLVRPAWIVTLASLLGCISGLVILLTSGDMLNFLIPLTLADAWVLPYILWFIFTVVLHYISRLLSGTGSFIMTLRNTGYGMLPWSVAHVFTILFYLEMSRNIGYHGSLEGMQAMETLSGMSRTGIVLLVLSVLFMLWTAYLWIYGTKYAHGLTLWKTLIPVLVLLVLYFLVATVPSPPMYSQLAMIAGNRHLLQEGYLPSYPM